MTQEFDKSKALGALDAKQIGSAIFERIDRFYRFHACVGLTGLIRKSVATRVGANLKNGSVSWEVREAGEQGELLMSRENHYRAIGDHKLNITTQQRPVIQCSAANTDKRSLEQTMLAEGLVEFHLTERELEQLVKDAAKNAIFQAEGYVEGVWDVHQGEDMGVDPNALFVHIEKQAAGEQSEPPPPLKSGEPVFHSLGPLDVVRDPYAPSWAHVLRSWVITRKWVSKHELAAQYPDMREKVLQLTYKPEIQSHARIEFGRVTEEECEVVPLWTLYHAPTAAVPGGRHVILGSRDCILYDGPLPYRRIPLVRETPDDIEGTAFGWSPMFDLLGPQDVLDALDTNIVSNQLTRGIGNVLVDDDADVSVEAISGFGNLVKKKRGAEVTPMEFPATPAEFFAFKQEKKQAMAELVGTNSVAMGTPNAEIGSDSSGAKLAFIEATAMRNNSGFEQSHVNLMRDVALMVIHLYRDFGGSLERKVKIAGKSRGYLVKSFSSDDLDDIDRVKVDVGNPVLRTTTGKMAVADKAVELGLIQKGELDKYILLLKEGTADPLYETQQAQLLRIRGENEALMEGKAGHNALLSDPHWKEIPEHLSLLDNPQLREPTPENAAVQQAVLAAVQQHIDLLTQMPQWMVLLRGGPEALAIWQQVQASIAPPPMPGDATGTPPPAPGEPSGTPPPKSGAADALNPEASKPETPGMPSMPTNPGTGQPADLGTPGVLQ